MPPRPNIFEWATSELSQDAFLCWLVAHAGEHERPDVQHVARAFIALLWNRSHPEQPCAPADVVLAVAPRTQQAHTDVFFSASIHGKTVPFLVEDKVHTSHHTDQLQRYAAWLEVQKQQNGATHDVKVYYKTGHHFAEDLDPQEHGYSVLGIEEVVEFFDCHRASSEILEDYRSYVIAMRDERVNALAGYRALTRDFVQYEFLRALRACCPEHIEAGEIHRGRNRGGTPWTHYAIARFPKALAGADETLFLRIDARQDDAGRRAYYLGLRQYGRVKASANARRAKLERLAELRRHFHAACAVAGGALRFAPAANDHQGANESEIGLVFFDDANQTPLMVLSAWPALHRELLARISRMSTGSSPAR